MRENTFLQKMSNGMMKIAIFFVKLAIWFVVIYVVGMRLFYFGERLFLEKALSDVKTPSIEFTVTDDDTVESVGERLKTKGLIEDTLAFKFRAKIYKTKLNPNTYNLDKSMSIKNILDIFDDQDENYVVNKAEENQNEETYQLSPEDQGLNIEESTSEGN